MLPATPNRLTQCWFDWYCRYALRKHFFAVRQYGSAPLTPQTVGPRLILAATHQSFWDGILLNWWLRKLGWRQRWCMIDAEQVRRHPFFRRVGGFGVDRSDPADGRRAVRYAADLLQRATPDRPAALVLFPQGKIEPADAAEPSFEAGVWFIAHRAEAPVVPVAIRYEFWLEQRAEAMLAVSPTLASFAAEPRRSAVAHLRTTHNAAREQLRAAGRVYDPGTVLLQGRKSIKDWGRSRGGI